MLELSEPPEGHLTNHEVTALLRVVLLDIIDRTSKQTYILRGDHPSIDLRTPGNLCAISIGF